MSKSLTQFYAEFEPGTKGIADTLGKGSLFLPLLPIYTIDGLVHKWGSLDNGGGVGTRKLNAPMPDTASSTTDPKEERIIIMGGKIKTDIRMQVARPTEIARKTRVVARYADHEILQGEGTTDAEKLVGFKDRVTGNQAIKVATDGGAMTLALFNSLIDAVEDQGGGRVAVMNRKLCRKLKALVLAAAGGATVQDVAGGLFTYEGVTIVPAIRNHLGAELLPFTESCGSSNVTSSAYCFAPGAPGEDFSGVQIAMASNSIELVEEGIRDSQYVDVVELAYGLAVYQPTALARLYGITNA